MRLSGRRRRLERARNKGDELLVAADKQRAYEFLLDAIEEFPDDGSIRVSFATTLLTIRPEDVRREALKACELAFDDPVVLIRAAHLLVVRGDIDNGRINAERAEALAGPQFPIPSMIDFVAGLIAASERDVETAEARFRRAIAKDPGDGGSQYRLAQTLAHAGRREDALAVLDRALPLVRRKEELLTLREEIAVVDDRS